jgi:hypothetical protein
MTGATSMPRRYGPWTRLCTLFSFESGQEPTKSFRTGPFGASLRRMVTTSQSNRKRLAVATNLPSPAPRIGVRLLYDDYRAGFTRAEVPLVAKEVTPHGTPPTGGDAGRPRSDLTVPKVPV